MSKKRKWSGKAKRQYRRFLSYKKNFDKRVAKLRAKGIEPYESKSLNYREYKYIYGEELNDRIKEVERGERKSLGNINTKIISDQVYELSEKQAYSIFDYMKTLSEEERIKIGFNYKNINTAIMRIREGKFVREDLGLWDIIRERRKELFDQGLNKNEVRTIVSNEFFYPEEDEEDIEDE